MSKSKILWPVDALVLLSVLVQTVQSQQYVPAIPRSGLYPFYNTTNLNPSAWNGFEIDILDWMCNVSGQVLGNGQDNTPLVNCVPREEWFVGTFAEVFESIDNGTADFAIGLISKDVQREEKYHFVKPLYYSSAAVLFVNSPKSNLTFGSLRGKPVCAVTDYYLNKNNALRDVYGASRVVSLNRSVDAVEKLANNECVAMVGGDVGRVYAESLGLTVLGDRVSEEPIGIITSKTASQNLKDDLSVGLVSTMWAGQDSEILKYENASLIANGFPPNENLKRSVFAITGFSTQNGFDLKWEPTTPVFSGQESVNSSDPLNVTILMFSGSPLPLASIQNNSSFLDGSSSWIGMEVDIVKAICDGPYFNCEDVLVTDNLNDRLAYLDEGIANISIGDISATQDRVNNYSFVQPMYYSAGPAIYVTDSTSVQEPQPGLEYANGMTICTLYGSAYNDQAEAAGANLTYFNTTSDAVQGVLTGACSGLLYDSNVSFEEDGLKQASSDMSSAFPIGIAVAPNAPYSVYTALSALMVQLLDGYPQSDLINWSKEYAAGSYPNPQLYTSSQSVSNFVLSLRDNIDVTPGTGLLENTTTTSAAQVSTWVSQLVVATILMVMSHVL